MVTSIFPDCETEFRALGFLMSRSSGKVLRTGEHIVPEAALEARAERGIRLLSSERRHISSKWRRFDVMFPLRFNH